MTIIDLLTRGAAATMAASWAASTPSESFELAKDAFALRSAVLKLQSTQPKNEN